MLAKRRKRNRGVDSERYFLNVPSTITPSRPVLSSGLLSYMRRYSLPGVVGSNDFSAPTMNGFASDKSADSEMAPTKAPSGKSRSYLGISIPSAESV